MLNNADFQGYNRLLTNFAIERGSGGSFIADLIAPPVVVETQEYAVPKFLSGLTSQGFTNTLIGPNGDANIVEDVAPDLTTGFCTRRGLKSYLLDEIKAQPGAALFANEEVILQYRIDELRREMEIKVKAMLDARKVVSGYHASPSVKWDATSYTGVIAVENLEAAIRGVELSSGRSNESGNWKIVIPPLVADVLKAFLRTKLIYTDGQFTLGGKLPPVLAGAQVILPGAMQNTAAAGQTASIARIWNTDDVYLVYVDPAFSTNRRSYSAMAQMRWNAVSPSYGAYRWREANPMIKRTWVGTDIYDNLELLAAEGIYVLDDVLT